MATCPEKKNWHFTVIGRAARAALQFIDVHHPQVDGVIAKYVSAPIFGHNIDAGHVVFLLLFGIELEIIIKPLYPTRKSGPIVSGRIKILYAKVWPFSRHE